MRGFFIQHLAIIGDGREDQVIFGLVEGFDGEDARRQPTGLADEGLQDGDLAVVPAVVEVDFGRRQLAALGPRQQGLGQRVVQAVKMRFAGAARQFVKPKRDLVGLFRKGMADQPERWRRPRNSAWPSSSCRVSCMSRRSKRLR